MTVLLTMDFPVTIDDVAAVGAEMNSYDNPPEGLIAHVVTKTDGGVHITDIWESQEHFERFSTDLLGPAVAKVAAERGLDLSNQGPPTFSEAFDLIRGR